ncbi:PQ loop repeat-containing protein 2 [Kappamyces sp. JEL0829]|nr:PQ loop repeat-containing protein 2 [Kappamyces sp. JEL0829]
MSCTCLPLQKDGHAFVSWIGEWFGDCIYTPWELASFYFAYAGTFCTMIAMGPQVWMNYKLKSTQGLSLGLLLFWCFGDIGNLSGALLTQQLPSQVMTAWLFTLMDVAILLQYFYYEYARPFFVRQGYVVVASDPIEEEVVLPPPDADDLPSASPPSVTAPPLLASVIAATSLPSTANAVAVLSAGALLHRSLLAAAVQVRLCNATAAITPELEIIGYFFAWQSGMFYFSSRIPQVWKNYREKSVKGLSFYLFALTIMGNLGYGISVLLRLPSVDAHFYLATLPYLIGSLGVLAFDLFILTQSVWYGGF